MGSRVFRRDKRVCVFIKVGRKSGKVFAEIAVVGFRTCVARVTGKNGSEGGVMGCAVKCTRRAYVYSLGVERELTVHDREHFLAQYREEVLQHLDDVRVARVVVFLQVAEQVLEKVRVLFVHHPVRFFEHVVETHPGFVQHVPEVLCAAKRTAPGTKQKSPSRKPFVLGLKLRGV